MGNRSGANVWGFFTIDTERGILYMPFGEPTTDYWGGDRKGANLFGTSLVAVDAQTGKLKWYFQAVHHDTWDYDLSAPPVLVDVKRNGRIIPAVAQVTKMRSLNPDGVVVSADYSQAITVIREMKRQGLIKPVVGATQLISSAILKAAPEIPIVAPATFYATMKSDTAAKFVGELQPLLRKESGLPPEIEPSMYDANIYEIVSMYIEGKRQERHS